MTDINCRHIDFVLNRVRMLIYFGVTPYLTFDGDNLPSKSETELERRQKREESKAFGLELYHKGRVADAYQELQKAVDVTPYMARELIEELKKLNVQYVVAPYEADAQLVFLERQGIIDGIISEDSDMLVFGAKKLLSKLDQHGDCIEISRSNFSACREVSFIGWTDADFRRMCILSGCDYLPNIPKMGLKTAYRSIRKYKTVEKALRMLQLEGRFYVPAGYLERFKQAELTFIYQRVFCPVAEKLVTLTPVGSDVSLEDLTFIGDDLDPEVAVGVANGNLDPSSKQPITLKPPTHEKRLPNITRRQTFGSSAELKPKKPISSYFTPKRVPLAELDPNSLTPSPSQQRLLERHTNSSWEASPAPGQPTAIRSAPSNRVSEPLTDSGQRSTSMTQARRASTFPSIKRPRLCSEAEDGVLPSQSNCQSRFFAGNSAGSSPSGEKLAKSKKPRKSTIGVFSDDAAEEIMSHLPDPSGKPGKQPAESERSKLSTSTTDATVTKDVPETQTENEGLETENQADTDRSVSIDTNPKAFQQVLDYHVEKQNSTLLSKFAFQPRSSSGSGNGTDSHNPQAQNPRCTKTVKPSPGLLMQPRGNSPIRKRLTPLQRLGQSALSRSRSMNFPAVGSLEGNPSPKESTPMSQNPMTTSTTSAHQGSEDLLVPNSDEDDPDNSDNDNDIREPAKLDLKQFTFAAA